MPIPERDKNKIGEGEKRGNNYVREIDEVEEKAIYGKEKILIRE